MEWSERWVLSVSTRPHCTTERPFDSREPDMSGRIEDLILPKAYNQATRSTLFGRSDALQQI